MIQRLDRRWFAEDAIESCLVLALRESDRAGEVTYILLYRIIGHVEY